MTANDSIFETLMATIAHRRENPSETSYTSSLMQGGVEKIGNKISEEAREVIEAASEPGNKGRDHLIYESADLLYHLFVLLGFHEIELDEVQNELKRRFGTSGLEEKASRPKR